MDGSSAVVAENPGRHAPQRTSATGKIAVSLPINVAALAKAHGHNWSCLKQVARQIPQKQASMRSESKRRFVALDFPKKTSGSLR